MVKNKVGLLALGSVVCMLSFGSAFAKTWQCKAKCTGQFGSHRGLVDKGIDADSHDQAMNKARMSFDESCKAYHFYNSGGGQASATYTECN